MKLVPRERNPFCTLRSQAIDPLVPDDTGRNTPVTMDRRGGMARDERPDDGVVLGLGSRFRVPALDGERVEGLAGPAARPYRVELGDQGRAQRLLGLPLVRFEVEVQRRGQAYRVLEPSSSRFRMRSKGEREVPPDPRFTMAGRGGPKVLLEEPGT